MRIVPKLLCTAALVVLGTSHALAASWRDQASPAQVVKLEKACQAATDMTGGREGQPVQVPGWKSSIPLREFTYRIPPRNQEVKVILLDPPASKAADWIGNATVDVVGHYDHALAMKLAARISEESGFHFPVRGFVDEGDFGLFLFKDGIAVKVDERVIPRKARDSFEPDRTVKFTPEMLEAALRLPPEIILATGRKARLASISPEEFLHLQPRPSSNGARWNPDDIREAYQKAWNSDRNELITRFLKVYRNGNFPE